MFVIGDIHGQYDLLTGLYNKIKDYGEEIYSVGDLIDRGPGVVECVKFVKEHGIKAVMGNHEDMYLQCVDENGEIKKHNLSLWIRNGGDATMSQLEDITPEERKEFYDFISSMPLYIFVDKPHKTLVLHAGFMRNFDEDLETNVKNESMSYDFLWYREAYLYSKNYSDLNTIIVTGHTPLVQVWFDGKNRFNIDTGAFVSGTLTALRIDKDVIELHSFNRETGYQKEEFARLGGDF